jgi:hypothetical protein
MARACPSRALLWHQRPPPLRPGLGPFQETPIVMTPQPGYQILQGLTAISHARTTDVRSCISISMRNNAVLASQDERGAPGSMSPRPVSASTLRYMDLDDSSRITSNVGCTCTSSG